jgi:putative peptide zinc metalloprotease protein
MASNPHYSLSTVDRPLALCARRDIQLAPAAFAGQSAYVLKDPLSLELFHLTAEEFFLFQALRAQTTLGRLRREFERRFAPRRISPEALQHGLNQLHNQGLLLSEASAQGRELLERGNKRRRQEWLLGLARLLSFRLGSIDATGFIDGLYGKVRWLFSLPMLAVATSVLLYAAWLLLAHGREVVARLPGLAELSQPRYWLLWLVTIAAVKVVHELGHALTCKHLGGRCHEMGLLLLAFMPCLYCDVSDAWRLSSKWRRIAVSAAGMAVEVVIAAAALAVWWHTQPGLLHIWCLSIVVVCSFGTLLVNANPLMRYDGYYILSDLAEVPNLASRAQGLLSGKLRRWLLNQPPEDDPLLSPRRRRALMVYAVAAKVYLTLLVVFIFAGLLTLARPYRLENLVYTLGAATLAGMLVGPIAGVWQIWRNPSNRPHLRGQRMAVLLGLVIAIVAGVLYWPIDRTVTGPVVFVPAEGQAVYAATGGELVYAVPAGTAVHQGDVVARLTDPKIDFTLAEQEGEYQVRRVRYEQLESLRAWDERSSAQTPTAQAALADAQAQLAEQRRQAQQLSLTAPIDGVVIAPPTLEHSETDDGQLPTWSGSPLEPRNAGCWIEPGTVLCTVADPRRLDALVAIDQADVLEVKPGQPVRILVASSPVRVLEGEVVEVAQRGAKRATPQPTADPGKYHLVEVRLTTDDELLLVGSRGTAKIEASHTTLGAMLSNQLRRMLRLPW